MFGKRGDTPTTQPQVQPALPAGVATQAPQAEPTASQAQVIPGLDLGGDSAQQENATTTPAPGAQESVPAKTTVAKPARAARTGRSDTYYDIKTRPGITCA